MFYQHQEDLVRDSSVASPPLLVDRPVWRRAFSGAAQEERALRVSGTLLSVSMYDESMMEARSPSQEGEQVRLVLELPPSEE